MAQDTQEAVAPANDLSLSILQDKLPELQAFMVDKAPDYILKIVIALVVFWIGSAIAKRVSAAINRHAENNSRVDTTLGKLAATCVRYGIMIASILQTWSMI